MRCNDGRQMEIYLRQDALIDCNIYRRCITANSRPFATSRLKLGRNNHCLHRTFGVAVRALHCAVSNRMNDLVHGFRLKGHVIFPGQNIYADKIDPVAVRRHIGMVFQQSNPRAMSIYRNVAFRAETQQNTREIDGEVEQALRSAADWDEVKDKLKSSGLSLSDGQQQRQPSRLKSIPNQRCC